MSQSEEEIPRKVGYLSFDDILDLFGAIQDCSRDQTRLQLRDVDGLDSALHRPRNHAGYAEADFAILAAMLAHGIAEGQHFLDGTKRLAQGAMIAFLRINETDIRGIAEKDLEEWIWRLSADLSANELAALIRPHLVARPLSSPITG